MALGDPVITYAGFIKIELPSRTVRLCDGGFLSFDGEDYEAADAVFGTIAACEEIEDAIDDSAPGGGFTLFPAPDADLAELIDPAMQGARVRIWTGEVDADMKTVSAAELEADLLIDVPAWDPVAWTLDFATMARHEKLFLRSEGNVCSSAWHQSVWPGEQGFDNCTDLEGQVAWGTEGAPKGTVSGSSSGSRGGGGLRNSVQNQ